MGRTSVKFSFDNGSGSKLAGIIDMPDSTPRLFGVFGPCFTCVKESNGALKICRRLAEMGIAMLRFDTTGVGQSEGDFAATNFTTRIGDLLAAVKSVTEAYAPPRLLMGHSISGTAALSAVLKMPSIEMIATVGSPKDPVAVIEKFKANGQIETVGDKVELMVVGQKAVFNKSFIDDMLAQKVPEDTAKIDRDLLVFHAPHDNIVNYSNAQAIYDAAISAKTRAVITLDPEATHLFEKRQEDAAFIADAIAKKFA